MYGTLQLYKPFAILVTTESVQFICQTVIHRDRQRERVRERERFNEFFRIVQT